MKKLTLSTTVVAVITLIGCGSGSSNTNSSNVSIQKAQYLDSNVSGVEYKCGDISGITDKNGFFKFKEGDNCTFSLNGVTLREENAVVGNIIEDNLSTAALLQSLDIDGNPDNGIKITENEKRALTKTDIQTVLQDPKKVVEIVNKVKEKTNIDTLKPKTKEEVIEHLSKTIAKVNNLDLTLTEVLINLSTNPKWSDEILNYISTNGAYLVTANNIMKINSIDINRYNILEVKPGDSITLLLDTQENNFLVIAFSEKSAKKAQKKLQIEQNNRQENISNENISNENITR